MDVEKKVDTTVITVRINRESVFHDESKIGVLSHVGREIELDGIPIYSDRMECRTYKSIDDPVKALERFVLGLEKLTDEKAAQVLDLAELVEMLGDMRYHIYTTEGLWCIDKNPREVSKEWIEANAFQPKYNFEKDRVRHLERNIPMKFTKDALCKLKNEIKEELVSILNDVSHEND